MTDNQQRAAELWAALNIAGVDGDLPDEVTTARVASAYRNTLADASQRITHRSGIPWYEAPIPPRFHRCEPQTLGGAIGVVRCACGAIASLFGPWMEKNSRRGPWWRRDR